MHIVHRARSKACIYLTIKGFGPWLETIAAQTVPRHAYGEKDKPNHYHYVYLQGAAAAVCSGMTCPVRGHFVPAAVVIMVMSGCSRLWH